MREIELFHFTQGHVELLRKLNFIFDSRCEKRADGTAVLIESHLNSIFVSDMEHDEVKKNIAELSVAIKVCFALKTFEPGWYGRKIDGSWQKIKGPNDLKSIK